MKRLTCALGIAAIAMAFHTLPLHSQNVGQSSEDVITRWLLNSCGVGDDNVATQQLRVLGEQARASFIQAFAAGPAEALVREVAVHTESRYAKRQALLQRGTGLGLSPEHLAAARSVTRTEFVNRATTDFVQQYRTEALRGLAVVGGEDARAFLRTIADDETSEFRVVASLALEGM